MYVNNKKSIKKGFVWSFFNSIGTQAAALLINIVLANMLGPNVFGIVAMVTIFMAISNVFVDSGFSSALIRKVDRTESDFSTAFYFSLIVSLIFYFSLFIFSPYIAEFYTQPELTLLIRIMALSVIINVFSTIQNVKLTIKLDFKTQTKCNFVALAFSSLVSLVLAFFDYGVWVLVYQQLIWSCINVLMINFMVPWAPRKEFSKKSFDYLFGFGYKLLLSGLLDAIYNNMYGLIIGKQYSAAQLAFFNQANKLSSIPAKTLTNVIQKVTYPMLSNIQDDRKQLDYMYLMTLKVTTFIVFPMMLGICVISTPLISLLLGEEWLESANILSILSIAFALYPIHAINLNLLKVKGRSDLFLKLEIMKKIVSTIILIVTVPLGIKFMCFGIALSSCVALFINTYYTGKLSTLTMFVQFKSLIPIAIIAIFSSCVAYIFGSFFETNFYKIIGVLFSGLIVYLSLMLLFQRRFLVFFNGLLKD